VEAHVPLLETLPKDELERVLEFSRRRKFERGEVVYHDGDPADTIHLVSKGHFAARVTTPLGDTAIFSVLGPGDTFGEIALLDARPRSATVAALESAETRSIHKLDFDRMRREHPQAWEALNVVVAAHVRRLSHRLVEALYVPADLRIRRRLCEMAALYGTGQDPGEVTIPLSQDDIAGLAGTSRATVNRVVREEEEKGTLELGRRRIRVLDIESLRARAARST
jgi:CRP/FNR family transcriptional regulator, cyclic AMP receptor protein